MQAATVLVVDDDADILNVVEDHLRDSGFNVLTADSSMRALDLLKTNRPNLILVDIMMPPGPDGFYLLEMIRSNPELESTPVVMLTAQGGVQFIMRSQELSATDYLMKPFTGKDLVDVVKKYT